MIEFDLSMCNACYESFMDIIVSLIYALDLKKINEWGWIYDGRNSLLHLTLNVSRLKSSHCFSILWFKPIQTLDTHMAIQPAMYTYS